MTGSSPSATEGLRLASPEQPVPPVRVAVDYFPTLDGLRAIAILLVLYNHVPQLMGHDDGTDGVFWWGSRGAWLGVDLFFVLSGFLITNILLQAKGKPHALRRFWVRRALRIFPLAYAYLLVLLVLAVAVPGFGALRDKASFIGAATYTLNFHIAAEGWNDAAFAILWSLCVEEHFYFVWPLVALFARRAVVVVALIAVLIVTPVLRAHFAASVGSVGVYVMTMFRWDTLAWGALLAIAWNSRWRTSMQRIARVLLLPAIVVVGAIVLLPISAVDAGVTPWFETVGFSLIAGSFAVCCVCALDARSWMRTVLSHPWLVWMGRVSYGLYIWHVVIAAVLVKVLDGLHVQLPLHVSALLWLALLLPFAALSYRCYEAPMLRLKQRFSA